jgi:hypothetical protein
MIELTVLLIVALLALYWVVYLLGFWLGGSHWLGQLTQLRSEAAESARRMHELTYEAFIEMAEHAQGRARRADASEAGQRKEARQPDCE